MSGVGVFACRLRAATVRESVLAVASLLCLLTVSCDPPGKPRDEAEIVMTTDFKTLFSQNCSGCHGDNGRNGAVRPIHDPVYLAAIPKSELQKVIEEGRDGTSMPPWLHERGGPLEPAQVDALVNGIEQNWAKPGYTLPDPPSYLAGDYKGDPLEGHKLFNRNCFMCHGKGARVGLVTDPSFLTLASDQSFRTALIAGRSDLGMPDYRYLNHGGALTDRNVTDIASYLASLRPAQSAGGAQ